MIEFFQSSWAFWWLVAILCILRWFHRLTEKAEMHSESQSSDRGSSFNLPHPSSL